MAFSSSTGGSLIKDDDPELKGDVDFDFFGADESGNKENSNPVSSLNESPVHSVKSYDSHDSSSKGKHSKTPSLQEEHSRSVSRSPSPQHVITRSRSNSPASSIHNRQSNRSKSVSRSPSPSINSSRSRSKSPHLSHSSSSKHSLSKKSNKSSIKSVSNKSDSSAKVYNTKDNYDNDKKRSEKKNKIKSPIKAADSDSEVTDVSSIPTDDESPICSPQVMGQGDKKLSKSVRPMHKDTVHFSRAADMDQGEHGYQPPNQERCQDQDVVNAGLIMRALLTLDQERHAGPKRKAAWLDPSTKERLMSQKFDRDAETRRLMACLIKGGMGDGSGLMNRPHHSTINRQKYQRVIQTENELIHHRLSHVIRPTPGMTRKDQLFFYQVQSEFGVVPLLKPPLRRAPTHLHPLTASLTPRVRRPSAGSSKVHRSCGTGGLPKTFVGSPSARPEWPSGW